MSRDTKTQERDGIEQYLAAIDYPARRNEVIEGARQNDAPSGILMKLRDLPEEEFEDKEAVLESLPMVGGRSQTTGGTPHSPATRVRQPGQRDVDKKPTGGRERSDRER